MLYNLIFDFLRENIYDLIIYDRMAKQIGKTPYKLVKLDCDEIIDWDHINNLNENLENGVSLCLRSEDGHPQRGGYFFHFIKDSTNTDKYTVYDFYKNKIIQVILSNIFLILLISKQTQNQREEIFYK